MQIVLARLKIQYLYSRSQLLNAMNPQRSILEAMLLTLRVLRERAPNIDIAEAALKEERSLLERITSLPLPPATPSAAQPQPEGLAA